MIRCSPELREDSCWMNACRLTSGTAFPCTTPTLPKWAGLKGTKNGELLQAAEIAGYDALLTIDHGMPQQQDLAGWKLSVALVRSRTSQIEDLLPLVDAIMQALAGMRPGQCVVIPLPD